MNGPHDPNGSYYPMAGPGPSSQANAQASAPSPPMPSGPFVQPHQDLQEFLQSFWTRQMEVAEREQPDFKTYPLPLARIKKVMKSDEDVKMISAEAPILFSRACEIFISELTCRAWLIAESHKRRTLQKSDVAAAIAFSDMFDFLIDVVPREEPAPAASAAQSATGPAPQPQQLIQQHQQQQQQQLLTQTNPHLNAFDQGPVGHEPMFGSSHVGQPEDEALYRDFILDGEGA